MAHVKYLFTVTGLRHLKSLEREVLRGINAYRRGFRRLFWRTQHVEPLARALELPGVITQFLALSWPNFHVSKYEEGEGEACLELSKVAGREHERHFLKALESAAGTYGRRHLNVFATAVRQAKRFLSSFSSIYEALNFVFFVNDLSILTDVVIGPETMERLLKEGEVPEELEITFENWVDRIHKEFKTMVRELTSSEAPQIRERALKLAVFFNKNIRPWDDVHGLTRTLEQIVKKLPLALSDGKIVLFENLTPENEFLIGYFVDHEMLRMLKEGRLPTCPLRGSPQFTRCRTCSGNISGEINRYCVHARRWILE
ncbi:MAG TPA: hypothetical protein ENG61_00465 [Candidatus Korarchaeota archaeon]|nr:hypothetical protein [Candidatus Korarchaeota archaeon]